MSDVFIDGATNAGTLMNTPRRRRFSEMSRKKRSTMFSQDAEVGVLARSNMISSLPPPIAITRTSR